MLQDKVMSQLPAGKWWTKFDRGRDFSRSHRDTAMMMYANRDPSLLAWGVLIRSLVSNSLVDWGLTLRAFFVSD